MPALSECRELQESHCTPVTSLVFNRCQDDCHNLFATVGKDQVSPIRCCLQMECVQ